MSLKNLFLAALAALTSFAAQAGSMDAGFYTQAQKFQKFKATQKLCKQIGPQLQYIPKEMRTQEICQTIVDGQKKYPGAIVRAGYLASITPAVGQDRFAIGLRGGIVSDDPSAQ
jgi:hypothetical protein